MKNREVPMSDIKKRRDLKIIISSNAPNTNSGYACEIRDVFFRLAKDGWPVAIVGFYGVEGYHTYMDGGDLIDDRFAGVKIKVYPKMADPYGGDALVSHAFDYGAHVAMVMQDLPTIHPQYLQQITQRGVKFIPWLPIDQEPVQQGVLQNLNFAHKILTFSKFGQHALENEGFTSTMIYEGTDLEMFKPLDKEAVRKELNLPQDAFLFGMIGANKENPPRKGYQEALEAFRRFYDNHPEAAIMFHTQQINPGGGFPILDYARHLKVNHRCFMVDQYAASFKSDSKQIAKEISAFDVQLHPSQTEGFGLLIIESQACGIPVIVNRCHSQPELLIEGKTGEVCETDKPHWRSAGGYTYPANVNSLHDKMETMYRKLKDPKIAAKIKVNTRKFIDENFNIDTLIEKQWTQELEKWQDELLPIAK